MKDNNVTRKDLESLIRIALKRLYDNDNYLICKQILMQFIIQKDGIVFPVLEMIFRQILSYLFYMNMILM